MTMRPPPFRGALRPSGERVAGREAHRPAEAHPRALLHCRALGMHGAGRRRDRRDGGVATVGARQRLGRERGEVLGADPAEVAGGGCDEGEPSIGAAEDADHLPFRRPPPSLRPSVEPRLAAQARPPYCGYPTVNSVLTQQSKAQLSAHSAQPSARSLQPR
eukprot:gene7250-biopygen11419